MPAYEMMIILATGALLAGFLGALSGLGGGIIIVPLLVLGFDIDIHYAIGTSLIAVIATSSGASSAYVREGFTNIRLGMLLETATCLGAILGVVIGSHLPNSWLSFIFGSIMLYTVISSLSQSHVDHSSLPQTRSAVFFKLDSSYPTKPGSFESYHVQHLFWGYLAMFMAGTLSGILGIGSGVIKVLALDKIMQLPFKVSTTTSNFMIGVTAAASAGIYLHLGYIEAILCLPVVVGVTIGALLGARLLLHIHTTPLRILFNSLVFITALQMIYKGIDVI